MTLEELKEKLRQVDEIDLLFWLDITTEELIYYLSDVIEEKQDVLRLQFEDEEEDFD